MHACKTPVLGVLQYADLAIKVLVPERLSGKTCVINNMVSKSAFLRFNIAVKSKVTCSPLIYFR